MYYFYIFGNAPLHSKASIDPGLNLLVQNKKKSLGMRIWFLDKRPHVWEPLEFASLYTFVSFKKCLLEQLSSLKMAAMSMSIILEVALETTPELLTYLQILGFIDTICISYTMEGWYLSQP